MRKRCTCGIRSSKRPGRDQSSLRGGTPPSPTLHQHRPVGERPVGARAFADRIDHELGGHAAGDHHRAAGEELRPVDGAAPQHRAVPARRAFVGIKRLAHQRMDAVGADQDIAARGGAMRAVAAEEISGDAGLVLREGAEPVAGMDARLRRAARAPPGRSRSAAGRDGSRTAEIRSRRRCRAARARSPGRSGWCRTARSVRMPTASSRGSRPSSASSLIACGSVLMPTPSSRMASDCSKISQSMPRACSIKAAVRPPMPPPTMMAFIANALRH